MAITEQLASFVAGLESGAVPDAVRARARALVLDCVGNVIRAGHEAESTPSLLAMVRAVGLDRGALPAAARGPGR